MSETIKEPAGLSGLFTVLGYCLQVIIMISILMGSGGIIYRAMTPYHMTVENCERKMNRLSVVQMPAECLQYVKGEVVIKF